MTKETDVKTMTFLCVAMLVTVGSTEAAGRRWATEGGTGPAGGQWGRAVASDGSRVAAARGPQGARGVAWENARTDGRGVAVEGRQGRRAAAWTNGEQAAWGYDGPVHQRARVMGPNGTAVVANGPAGARARVNGQDGFLWGREVEGGTALVGGKKGEGLYRGFRAEDGGLTVQHFDRTQGGWMDIGSR